MTDFPLDRLNINDDEHLIQTWLVADGEVVSAGQPIAEVETSKATVELEAKGSGLLRIVSAAGRTVRVGEIIYAIEDGDGRKTAADRGDPVLVAQPIAAQPIVKAEALQEASRASSGAEEATKPVGFVTQRPILRPRRSSQESPAGVRSTPTSPLQGLDTRKRSEIESLSFVNPSGLVSCLFVDIELGARSNPQPGHFATNISDLICYESARAIAAFPLLSAYFDPEHGVRTYDRVMIGYSIDANDDLTVYNLGECQSLTLTDVRSRILTCVEAHLLKKVSAWMLEPTSFTVTDLSGFGVSGFVPLINGPQSAILGYAQASTNIARLSLAFDHRVMGGRYAASFLTDLRSRIESHITSTPPSGSRFACDFCDRDGPALRRLGDLGLFRILDTFGRERLACPLCMGGY